MPKALPGGAVDVHEIWAPAWGGRAPGASSLRMTVEAALEARGKASKTTRVPVDMDAHTRGLARCLIRHAPAVRMLRIQSLMQPSAYHKSTLLFLIAVPILARFRRELQM